MCSDYLCNLETRALLRFRNETGHNYLVGLKMNTGNILRLLTRQLALRPFNYTVVQRAGKAINHSNYLNRIE